MHQLNLPEFDPRVNGQEIFCLVRKKWIALTPEEWVRQHVLNLLIEHLHYPKGMMKLEQSMHYFKNMKRSDITILSRNSDVFMLVECKASSVKVDQKVVNQASEYSKVLDAKFMAVTNGLHHFLWEKGTDKYDQLTDFPTYF